MDAFFEGVSDNLNKKEVAILYYSLYSQVPQQLGFKNMLDGLRQLRDDDRYGGELLDILRYRYKHIKFVAKKQELNMDTPLEVHCSYTTHQLLAGVGYYNDQEMPAFREGVLHLKEGKTDIFLVTLNKSEKEFTETTMYHDYAISENLFHWESQSRLTTKSPTFKRYVEHHDNKHDILLFVRGHKKLDGYTSPYVFLGKAHYVRHENERPVQFVWRLEEQMPSWALESWLSLAQ